MDELEGRLRAVLDDPEAMKEISALAQGLMGAPQAAGDGQTADAGQTSGGMLPDGLQALLRNASRGHPVAAALGPYLREDRRRRLERALAIASASRAAGAALHRMGGMEHGI